MVKKLIKLFNFRSKKRKQEEENRLVEINQKKFSHDVKAV